MNIFTNSALTLRRRSVWEAVDGGALLWRKNFVYFIPFFAVPVWVIACALRFLPPDFLFISYIGLWWLKPFFDRLLLHVLSVNFFSPGAGGVHRPRQPESLQGSAAGAGGEARFGSAAGTGSPKNLRNGLFKNLCKGLLGDLFWRRFSPARSARMPLRVLEGLGGKQYSQRKKTLSKGGLGFGRFLSLLGLAAEVMLLLGEVVFVLFIIQMFFPSAFPNIMDNFESLELFIFIAFSLNFILAESLYVCMGFGLYVNSRVEMEGWDLQILFQKFSEKARHRNVQAVKTILVVCFFLAFLASPLSRALPAEEAQGADIENSFVFFPDGFPEPGGDCLEKLSEILLSEDFGGEREGWELRLKEPLETKEKPEDDLELPPWMAAIKEAFGFILRLFIILVIAAFLAFLFFWAWKYYNKSLRGKIFFPSRQKIINYENNAVHGESPGVLFKNAENFFSSGRLREAWAACLEGCLAAYSKIYSLSFPPDATEYGCLVLVNRAFPEDDLGFTEIVNNWIFFAYGGRNPGEGAFQKALAHGYSILQGNKQYRSQDES